MPYTLSWKIPGRVALATLRGEIVVEEVEALDAASLRLVNEGTAPVHFIVDASTMTKNPTDIRRLRAASTTMMHPAAGWWIIIGAPGMASFAVSVLSNIMSLQVRSARTVDGALNLLHKLDPTLPIPAQQGD